MSDLLIGYGFPESFLDGCILECEGRPWRLRNGRLHQVGSGEEPPLASTASSQENVERKLVFIKRSFNVRIRMICEKPRGWIDL